MGEHEKSLQESYIYWEIIMKIFVQVGNGKFESLIKEIDRLLETKQITAQVTCQIGHGEYIPKHCEWFTFESPLTKYQNEADLVISHGGPGSVFEILRKEKKLIAIPNRNRTDPRHQVEFLEALSKETESLIYCDEFKNILEAIKKAKEKLFVKYERPICTMGEKIKEFLK